MAVPNASSKVGVLLRRAATVKSEGFYSTAVIQETGQVMEGSERQQELASARPFYEMPGPRGLPYVGSLYDYRLGKHRDLSKYHLSLVDRHAKYGNIVRQTLLGETTVHLFDHNYVKDLLFSEWEDPHVPPLLKTIQKYRKWKKVPLGLFNSNGEEWYRVRAAVQRLMMRPRGVATYLPHINEVADDYVALIRKMRDRNNEIDDFHTLSAKWSMESGGAICYGFRLGYLDGRNEVEGKKMADANREIFRTSMKLHFSLPGYNHLNTPTWKSMVEAEDYFAGNTEKYLSQSLAKIKRELNNGNVRDDTFVFQKTLQSRPELTYNDASILSLSMLADGLQTTLPLLYFTLYCLAKNPQVQDKVLREIRTVKPIKDAPVTIDHLNKMPYMKAMLKETFRLFPIRINAARIPTKDIVIGGYRIPKGTRVENNTFVQFRNPEYFSEPNAFKPERWLRGTDADALDPFIMLPFGHGPRMCAGRRFVEQDIYMLVTKILNKYRLEWNHPDMGAQYQMLMVPDCPLKYSFVDRK